jgi:hypothetical protein
MLIYVYGSLTHSKVNVVHLNSSFIVILKGRGGRDRMVVEFCESGVKHHKLKPFKND